MRCIYCNNKMDGGDAGIYNCIICPVPPRFICWGVMPQPEIAYIQFTIDNYLIEIKLEDKVCNIFKFKDITRWQLGANLVTLNYIPDINPQNVTEFLQRILDVKAFI